MARASVLLALLLACACSRTAASSTSSTRPVEAGAEVESGTYLGRRLAPPMGWQGADWLERPEREDEEKPEHVLDVIGVARGSVVADVGTGSGYFAVRLARRVGPSGRVLATDLQPEMLAMLRARAGDAGLANVEPLLATPGDAKLPRAALDLVLMVDVYHELPDPVGTLAQTHASLAASGRLALVEYRGEDTSVPIKPEHKMTLAQIRRELEANGFVVDRVDESLPSQRIVVARPRRG